MGRSKFIWLLAMLLLMVCNVITVMWMSAHCHDTDFETIVGHMVSRDAHGLMSTSRLQALASVAAPTLTKQTIVAVSLGTTHRRVHRNPNFEQFTVDRTMYEFRSVVWDRACRVPPHSTNGGGGGGADGFTFECRKQDYLELLSSLYMLQQTGTRAFYIIEDDTVFCERDFSTLEALLDRLDRDEAANAEATRVHIVLTGMGASGMLLRGRQAVEWLLNAYIDYDKNEGPDIMLARSRPMLEHVYRFKVHLNVHVGGHGMLTDQTDKRTAGACYEYACAKGLNNYDYFDFTHCGDYDLFAAIGGCSSVKSALLTSSVPYNTSIHRGYPGASCRSRGDVRRYYDQRVLEQLQTVRTDKEHPMRTFDSAMQEMRRAKSPAKAQIAISSGL